MFNMADYRELALRTEASSIDERSLRQLVRCWEFVREILEEARDQAPLIDRLKAYGIYGKSDEELVNQLTPTYPVGDKALRIRQCLRLIHAIIGIIGECGEVAEKILEHIDTGEPLDVKNMWEESGDFLWFINLLLDFCGDKDIPEVARMNIAKLAERFKDQFTLAEYQLRDLGAESVALDQ